MGEELGVDIVEGGKISHIGKVAGGFNGVIKGGAGGRADGAEVLADAAGLFGNILAVDGVGFGVEGDLAAGEEVAAGDNGLAVGADGIGRGFG